MVYRPESLLKIGLEFKIPVIFDAFVFENRKSINDQQQMLSSKIFHVLLQTGFVANWLPGLQSGKKQPIKDCSV